MAGSLHGMATRYLSTTKMEQQCCTRIQPFNITFFIAMYSVAFYHIVTGIVGMVRGVGSLWIHLSWHLKSLVRCQNTPFMKYRPRAVDLQPENHASYLEGWTILIPEIRLNPEDTAVMRFLNNAQREALPKISQGGTGFVALYQTILTSFLLDFYTSVLRRYHATQTYFASSLLPATNTGCC